VPEAAVVMVAEALNLSAPKCMASSPSIMTFAANRGPPHPQTLCAEACQAARRDALAERAQARLGVAWVHGAGRSVTLDPVYCPGAAQPRRRR